MTYRLKYLRKVIWVKSNTRSIWKIINNSQLWQTVAAVLVALFTGILIRIAYTQNAINIATQRANVTLGRPDGTIMELVPPTVGKNILILMYFQNSGRVVAENFFARSVVAIGDEGPVSPEGWSFGPEPEPTPDPVYGAIMTFETAPIAAGAIQIQRAAIPKPLSATLAEELGRGQRGIIVQGKFEYDDGFGLHWTKDFCGFYDSDAKRFITCKGVLPDQSRPIKPSWLDFFRPHPMETPVKPRFGLTTVGQKWKRILPFNEPQATPIWTPPPHDAAHTEN